jgi:hypothetical protein
MRRAIHDRIFNKIRACRPFVCAAQILQRLSKERDEELYAADDVAI